MQCKSSTKRPEALPDTMGQTGNTSPLQEGPVRKEGSPQQEREQGQGACLVLEGFLISNKLVDVL